MLEVTIQFVETVTFVVTEVMVTKRMISVTRLLVLRTSCVDKKRNSEHFEEIKKRKRELKEVTRRDRAASFRVGGLEKNA